MNPRLTLGLVAALALAGCGGTSSSPPAAAAAPEVEVFTLEAARNAAPVTLSVQAALAVEREADLLVEEPGRLVEVLADQGARVARGAVLGRLEEPRLAKQVEQDRAEVQMLEAQIRQSEVLREAAEVELQRQSELRKEGLGSLRDFDRARFSLEATRHEVEKSRHSLERARARLEDNQMRLARLELRAPFEGIVSRRYARSGQYLTAGERVFRVTELRPLLVRFSVPEALRHPVEPGAVVRVAASEGGEARARVVRHSTVVDAASGAVECVAEILEPIPADWVPGIAVEIGVPAAPGGAPRYVVPAAAVRRNAAGGAEVFVVAGNRLERRAVSLGGESAAGVEVLSGLSAGEQVVTRATARLEPGQEVRIVRR